MPWEELAAALPRQPRLGIPHAWVERRGPPDVAPRRRIHGALEEAVIDEALQREVWGMMWEARERLWKAPSPACRSPRTPSRWAGTR